jgi:thioredoxin-dependent peroxiredoxin
MFRPLASGVLTGLLALAVAAPAAAQAPSEPAYLPVGATAPDFSAVGATRWGTLGNPVKLSDFRGKTVVLAFFPAARTRGCTIQMQTYRDEYQRVFNGGRDVVLIAISNDPAEALEDWARDEDFPFLFASDQDGAIYRAFGGVPSESGRLGRTLVVVNPEGSVEELLPRFREIDPTAYDELEAIVQRLSTANDG